VKPVSRSRWLGLGLLLGFGLVTAPWRARAEPAPTAEVKLPPAMPPGVIEPNEDEDDDLGNASEIRGQSDELEAAREAEAKALSDDEALRLGRARAPAQLGASNPLARQLRDVVGREGNGDQDGEARQIAREIEQFATFDIGTATGRYDIPVELNQKVAQYIALFQGVLRPHFVLWLARSSRYIPRMREILVKEGVPADTVYLALIESGFNTMAFSPARASGQWQFISSTGRRFGLRSDFWLDERRDPEKATLAAAHYLKELHGQLGSWYLAWAGYNAGGGTIQKAIRRGHSTDFWQLIQGRNLRPETKGYVPKLIAAALISKHPRAFGFDDVPYQEPLAFETIEVDEPTDLTRLAKAIGVDPTTLRQMNPSLRRFCTPPSQDGQPFPLRVPMGTRAQAQDALAGMKQGPRLAFKYHRLVAGESLGAIARRDGATEVAVARMNGLHRPPLRPGRELVIPVEVTGVEVTTDPRVCQIPDERELAKRRHGRWRHRQPMSWVAADDCQDPFDQTASSDSLAHLVAEAEPPPAPPRRRASAVVAFDPSVPKDGRQYRVKDGDSLWSISQACGVSLDQISAWNQIENPHRHRLFPGEMLWVGGAPAAKPVAAASAPLASAAVATGRQTYRLREGDNLWEISRRYKVSLPDLLRLNHLEEDTILHPGTELVLAE
jgi:membrane-bound lytic murein transglycosylase D